MNHQDTSINYSELASNRTINDGGAFNDLQKTGISNLPHGCLRSVFLNMFLSVVNNSGPTKLQNTT